MQAICLDGKILDKFNKGNWILLPNKFKDIQIGTKILIEGKKATVQDLVEGKRGRVALIVSYGEFDGKSQ
jgi:hypothetical protein